jgi:hypothetical protein
MIVFFFCFVGVDKRLCGSPKGFSGSFDGDFGGLAVPEEALEAVLVVVLIVRPVEKEPPEPANQ